MDDMVFTLKDALQIAGSSVAVAGVYYGLMMKIRKLELKVEHTDRDAAEIKSEIGSVHHKLDKQSIDLSEIKGFLKAKYDKKD